MPLGCGCGVSNARGSAVVRNTQVPPWQQGIEGAAVVKSGGYTFLLALCEGNSCSAGSAGQKPGGGLILVYYLNPTTLRWTYNDKISLPTDLPFVDFSGMDVRPNGAAWDIGIVSQENSGVYFGTIQAQPDATKPTMLDWHVNATKGVVYFPSGYCNVEGFAFLGSTSRFATCSDATKSTQSNSCKVKEQSVHIWQLATAGAGWAEQPEWPEQLSDGAVVVPSGL